jgi:uncharacterized repeat protein (TIGR01451 family)
MRTWLGARKATAAGAPLIALLLFAGVALGAEIRLQPSQRGTESDCGSGTVTWHFILNNLDPGTAPLTLNAEFAEDGVLTDVGTPVGQGRTQHFFIDTTGDDTLLDAWVEVGDQSGTPRLVLSHIACGPPAPPSVEVDKTGDELSKIGDQVTYNFTITNTGGWPLTLVSITDDKVGNLLAAATAAGCDELAVGSSCMFSVNFTIPAGAADPFVNTVTVEYDHAAPSPTANVTDTDSHSTNLFQPAVEVIKDGPAEAHVGDTITYTFTINNLSSSDSPNLILDSITDTVLGNLAAAAPAACDELASGASCTFTVNYTIPMGAPNPLVNVVTVHYHPQGFPNDITDTDDHSVIVRGAEGCTPGYWKVAQHLDSWVATGYSPNQTLESVFNVPDSYGLDNFTLRQALSFKGGSTLSGAAQILLRAGVAALLNAAHPDVDYALSTAEVITQVNAALASGSRSTILALAADLDAANNSDCPLN